MRAALAALALALVLASPASADQLVFGCGQGFENLCRARADGSGLVRFAVPLRGRAGRVAVRITVTPPGGAAEWATRAVRISR
jgi:hypothetical protein